MEFVNSPRNPHRPSSIGKPQQPQRRVFSDFAARPADRPLRPLVSPAPKPGPAPVLRPVASQAPAPRPMAPPPAPSYSDLDVASALRALDPPAPSASARAQDEDELQSPGRRTGHAGIVGLVCFVVLGALLASPLLPGKILANFPGSSQSESSGEQSIACIDDLENVHSATAYTTKLGSPIVYRYSTTTTQQATCDGKALSASIGHTSQFNPLGLLANVSLALIVAIGIAKLWRLIFGRKN